MEKILMIGPFPDPIHGMSMANEILFEGLNEKGYTVDRINTALLIKIESSSEQKKVALKKLFIALSRMKKDLLKLFSNSYDMVYITPGHSFLGFMRYSPYLLISMAKRTPYFLHSHGGQLGYTYRDSGKLKKGLLKFLIKRAKGAIVLGDSLRWMFQDLLPDDKIFICYNGVSRNIISSKEEITEKLSKTTEQIKLLYLSNLMEEKGIIDIFNSIEYFKENNLNFSLKIAGNIEKNLEKKINYFLDKYKSNIEYLGVVRGEEKRDLLFNSDIFILPTYYPIEGQPISILESMVNGCAVITTNQGGIEDIFKNGINGIQCFKKDSYSIYLAVLNTMNNLKGFQKHNYEEALSKYTQNKFVEKLEDIFKISSVKF